MVWSGTGILSGIGNLVWGWIYRGQNITPFSYSSEFEPSYEKKCRNQADGDQNTSFLNVSRTKGHSLDNAVTDF